MLNFKDQSLLMRIFDGLRIPSKRLPDPNSHCGMNCGMKNPYRVLRGGAMHATVESILCLSIGVAETRRSVLARI